MRFHNLDLNLVHTLNVLLEERSVSAAAARLHVSQPAVSSALARLREFFNDELLVQTGRRMIPTAFAQTLVPLVRQVITSAEQLVVTSSAFDPLTSQRIFRIGISDYLVSVLVTPMVQRFERTAPGVTLELAPAGSSVIEQLERGELDLVMAPEQFLSAQFATELMFEEEHVVASCATNPATAGPMDEETFFAHGHIAVSIGPNRELSFAERNLLVHRDRRRIEVLASSFSTVPWMLIGTKRLAVIQRRLAERFQTALPIRFQPLPLPMPPLREMVQFHTARAQDPGLLWMLEEIRATLTEK